MEKEAAENKVVEIGENEAVEVQVMGFSRSGLTGDGPSKVIAEKVEKQVVEVQIKGLASKGSS